ncbi:branched-chain amino acid ABC transporter permease [Glaciimonas sp. PCH181]|uniref:branched-chain amino acid ABC transporter permease n=1 Tax=Glaciimonas sp. PCH181 TaxID=2133943 RepID=UPI000D3AB99C|nr:branched-chain amino acid ABC transporter permease [Glaciimonas sp. PCH181]PUA18899.1 branched-chain amino acid ABC transporter permease [Glaciimonas sp. PCH181]
MSTQSTIKVAPRRAAPIVLLLETSLAVWLYFFLILESWPILLALLILGAGALLYTQRNHAIQSAIAGSFAQCKTLSLVWATVLVLAYPFLLQGNTYILHLLIISQLYAVLALALNFQLGSANIPNFATGASYGIGAYTSALLAIHWGVSFWWCLLASAGVATIFGFLLGIPCMRTKNSYLALVTIAFGIVLQQLINNASWTGGPNGLVGIPAPTLFGHSFSDPILIFGQSLPSQVNFFLLAFALIVVSVVVANLLHNSRVGLAWNALRTDELAASAQGINVTWYKMLAFAVDAFMAAFAGTIYAFYVTYISPDNFTFLVSVTIMTMVIVGGMDNVLGVILGAFLLTILPEKFRVFSDYRLLIYASVVILMLIVRPQGLIPKQLRHYKG